jgi:hypothetical protein
MKLKYLFLSALLVYVFCLSSCNIEKSTEETPMQIVADETISTGESEKNVHTGLLFSNLCDSETQDEVKHILTAGGINPTYVEEVFSWVNQYNEGIGSLDTFELTPSFTYTEKNYVWYGSDDDYPDVSRNWWKVNRYDYTDVLCRSTAFYLMRDYVSTENIIPKSEWHIIEDENDWSHSWLVTDMDGFETNPCLKLTDEEIEQYFTIFNPITLPSGTSEQDMYTVIKEEWDRRGIAFQKSSVSLVTIWMQDCELTAASHAAVLVEYDKGLLLFEKTNPEYPYQATKFDTIEEVKSYMVAQLNSTFENGAGTVIVMQNNFLIE